MPGWALGATPTLLEHHRDLPDSLTVRVLGLHAGAGARGHALSQPGSAHAPGPHGCVVVASRNATPQLIPQGLAR